MASQPTIDWQAIGESLVPVARKLCPKLSIDVEDLVQVGLVAIWQKLPGYNPSIGTWIGWYKTTAYRAMVDEMRRVLGRSGLPHRISHARRIDAMPYPEAHRALWSHDPEPDESEVFLDRLMTLLPARSQEMVWLRRAGLTLREIADEWDMTESWASQTMKRIGR